MWRFILMTFAFLGWSFYTLSGGADYEPREGSRQAEALKARTADQVQLASSVPADADAASYGARDIVTRDALDLTGISTVAASASATAFTTALQTASAPDQVQTASFGGGNPGVTLAKPATIAQAAVIVPAATELQTEPQRDMRRITGTSVNMRAGPGTKFGILTRVTRDTEVEVLESFENGWLRLRVMDSNRIGWVSSKLVSSAPDRG